MSPPFFVLCIPGIALIFFIQMLICQAYHFHVTVSHTKRYSNTDGDKGEQDKASKSVEDKEGQDSYFKKAQDPQAKSEQGQQGKRPSGKGSQNKNKQYIQPQSLQSKDNEGLQHKKQHDPSKRAMKPVKHDDSGEEIRSDLPTANVTKKEREVSFNADQKNGDDGDSKEDVQPPKEDRLKSRRKSVFAESYDPAKDQEDLMVFNPKTPEEKEWLLKNLRNITLFEHLASDQIQTVVDAMFKHLVSEGDFVMKQGDKGSTFYVIQTGIFDVFVKDQGNIENLIHTYHNKGSFGELALLYNQPRAATILARTDGILWAVDGQTFRRIVHKITYQKRMMYESLINNVPMLKALEPYERANLVDALVPMTFKHNEEIIKQGADADGMYFIITGGVRIVMKTANNREILLKELSDSEYFGELALVTDKPRAASAFAVGTTYLAFLDRDAFERLLGPCMDVIQRNIVKYNQQRLEIEKSQDQ